MTDPVKSVLADAVMTISVHTNTEAEAIIRSLVGCAWDEEDGHEVFSECCPDEEDPGFLLS